jgi:hypothetical protein
VEQHATVDAPPVLQAGGGRYEAAYGGYLEFFRRLAAMPDDDVVVEGVPASWVPLCLYLNCRISRAVAHFASDGLIASSVEDLRAALGARCAGSQQAGARDHRAEIEALCAFRPETVDALWKVDRQWPVHPRRVNPRIDRNRTSFIVTGNGSFDRPEIRKYEAVLGAYAPSRSKVVVVPCAADKPYPSPMHQAVLDLMPPDYYLANATGVLGIVPMDLWPAMPRYDSGIPNPYRLVEVFEDYFGRLPHERVVVYCDFYSEAIERAFRLLGQLDRVSFVNPIMRYDDYLDLLDPARLRCLGEVLGER